MDDIMDENLLSLDYDGVDEFSQMSDVGEISQNEAASASQISQNEATSASQVSEPSPPPLQRSQRYLRCEEKAYEEVCAAANATTHEPPPPTPKRPKI